MTAPDRPWSEADRELVAELLDDQFEALGATYEAAAEAVLDQLTGDGWVPLRHVYGYHVDGIPGVFPPEDVTLIYRTPESGSVPGTGDDVTSRSVPADEEVADAT